MSHATRRSNYGFRLLLICLLLACTSPCWLPAIWAAIVVVLTAAVILKVLAFICCVFIVITTLITFCG